MYYFFSFFILITNVLTILYRFQNGLLFPHLRWLHAITTRYVYLFLYFFILIYHLNLYWTTMMTISHFASIKQPSPHHEMPSHPDASHYPMMGQVTMETADAAAAAGEKQDSRGSRRDDASWASDTFLFLISLTIVFIWTRCRLCYVTTWKGPRCIIFFPFLY